MQIALRARMRNSVCGVVAVGLAAGVSLGACTNDPYPPPLDETDSRPASQISIVIDDVPPIFLAYRDGESPWQVVVFTSQASLHFTAHGSYRVLAVCDRRDHFEIAISGRTSEDGATISPSCASIAAATAGHRFVNTSGSMSAPGRVLIDGKTVDGSVSNWEFHLAVTKGMHDLLAISNDDKVVMRPALDLENLDNAVPAIDASTGTPLRALDFAIANGVGDPSVSVSFVSKLDGLGVLDSRSGSTGVALPDAVAGTELTQTVEVTVQSGTTQQTAIQPVTAAVTTNLQMLPTLPDAEFGDGVVAWSDSLPDGLVRADGTDPSNGNAIHFDASASFLRGATQLSLHLPPPDDISDFQDDFVTEATSDSMSLSVQRTDGDVTLRSTRLSSSSSKTRGSR